MNIRNTAIASLIFVGLYNILFFHTSFGIGTGLLFLALNLYFYLTRNKDSKSIKFACYSSIVGTIFAFLFALRGNGIVQIANFTTAAFFSLVAVYLYKYTANISFQMPNFLLLPFTVIKNSIDSFFSIFKKDTWPPKQTENDISSSLIRGLLITVPIFGALLFLLVEADPIFGKLTQNFLSNIGERTIASFFVFVVLFSFGLIKILEKVTEQKEVSKISVGKSHELAIITGSVFALFAVFIAIQFRYLFFTVGERELSSLGIASLTYSEYVRKGFFELLIAATIAGGVIVYVLKYLHHLIDRQKLLVQILSGIVTVEAGLLLLSAAKRVFLYTDAHGLTRAREFGFVFLIWLAILLVVFLMRILKEMKKEQFFGSVITTTLLTLIFINVVNLDGLIATKYKPTVNNEIDYYYIASLSSDASDAWVPAIEDADKTLSELNGIAQFSLEENRRLYWTKETLEKIMYQSTYLLKKYGEVKIESLSESELQNRKWQSYNMSEFFAHKTVRENSGMFGQITALLNKANSLQERASIEVRQNTPLDRSTQSPLIR